MSCSTYSRPAPTCTLHRWTGTPGSAYRDELVTTGAAGLADLGEAIEVEQLVTPTDWAAQGLAVGTSSAAHTFAQTGRLRPSIVRGRTNVVLRRMPRPRRESPALWSPGPRARRCPDHRRRSAPKHRHERLNQPCHVPAQGTCGPCCCSTDCARAGYCRHGLPGLARFGLLATMAVGGGGILDSPTR